MAIRSGRRLPSPARALLGAFALVAAHGASATPIDLDNLSWSVHALIDESETVLGVDQSDSPRDNRGLDITLAGDFLYAGYNNPRGGFEVRRLDLSQTGNASFVSRVGGFRGKAIAVDDAGRVYLAEGNRIEVRSADLATSLGTLGGLTKSEGVAAARLPGGELALYVTDRTDGDLTRYLLTEGAGDAITGFTPDAAFGPNGDGTVDLGSDLRGVTVDASGRIWVAGRGDETVFRVSADGLTVNSVVLGTDPFDLATFDDVVLITLEDDLEIVALDAATLAPVTAGNIVIPFAALGLAKDGTLAGIAVDPLSGIYVANEGGETLPFPDDSDDDEPILFASFFPAAPPSTVPEPATLVLGTALLALPLTRSRGRIRRPREVAGWGEAGAAT